MVTDNQAPLQVAAKERNALSRTIAQTVVEHVRAAAIWVWGPRLPVVVVVQIIAPVALPPLPAPVQLAAAMVRSPNAQPALHTVARPVSGHAGIARQMVPSLPAPEIWCHSVLPLLHAWEERSGIFSLLQAASLEVSSPGIDSQRCRSQRKSLPDMCRWGRHIVKEVLPRAIKVKCSAAPVSMAAPRRPA